jgi:hypothetical protein
MGYAINERWSWIIRYAIVIVLALVLAWALGGMDLFKTTRFGKTGLNAARLVQFFGYGGALLVFWLTAQRAAALIGRDQAPWHHVKHIMVPLATLIVVATAHAVALLLLGPLMAKTVLPVYNWVFIAAIILSCAWLLAALLTGSSSLSQLFGGLRPQRR